MRRTYGYAASTSEEGNDADGKNNKPAKALRTAMPCPTDAGNGRKAANAVPHARPSPIVGSDSVLTGIRRRRPEGGVFGGKEGVPHHPREGLLGKAGWESGLPLGGEAKREVQKFAPTATGWRCSGCRALCR